MGQIAFSRKVNAPIDAVFERLTNIPDVPKHIPGIKRVEMLTSGPVGKGTKFRETRVMFGKEATETMEVMDFQPPKSVTIGATSCGSEFRSVFTLSRSGEGTLLEHTTSWRPVTLFARLMTPMGLLMKGSMRKMMEKDIDDAMRSFGG